MDLLEHQGKRLIGDTGVPIPRGKVVTDPDSARNAAEAWGCRVALKSQVPSGKRGKLGGIAFAANGAESHHAASELLGSEVSGFVVRELLVEECADIREELYTAVLNDPGTKGPLVLLSRSGGMDVEEAQEIRTLPVDIRTGLTSSEAERLVQGLGLSPAVAAQLTSVLLALYRVYVDVEATLVEVNPLAITEQDRVVALDSKISLDPAALPRHAELVADLAESAAPSGTPLEQEAGRLGLQYIELDGDVGVLANGAGLTMTTLDTVTHWGGQPANFLEIGGEAYTKATPALRLALSNPRVRSLLVNFCGAFARTDVMTEGVIAALEELRPDVPVFFTIHGTGEAEAIALVRQRLGVEPYESMDDAVRAAVAAARAADQEVMS